MKTSDLKPAPYNPRKISVKQLSALEKSMMEFGDLSGIVVNVTTGNVIGGHQRGKVLGQDCTIEKQPAEDLTGTVALGYIETPRGRWSYREVKWDEIKEKAANLAANKHGGEWDLPKVDVILDELKAFDFDLELTGFDFEEVTVTPSDEGPAEDNYAQQYGVIVVCNDEQHQEEVFNFLTNNGFNVKVVNT